MGADWIHPRELPFSEEEFFRAFCLIQPEEEARKNARFVGEMVRDVIEKREQAFQAQERGSTDPDETRIPAWVIGDGAFALLAMLSDDLCARVDAFMRNRWQAERLALTRNALYRPDGSILREPTPEVIADVDAVLASYAAGWKRTRKEMRVEVERWRERQA